MRKETLIRVSQLMLLMTQLALLVSGDALKDSLLASGYSLGDSFDPISGFEGFGVKGGVYRNTKCAGGACDPYLEKLIAGIKSSNFTLGDFSPFIEKYSASLCEGALDQGGFNSNGAGYRLKMAVNVTESELPERLIMLRDTIIETCKDEANRQRKLGEIIGGVLGALVVCCFFCFCCNSCNSRNNALSSLTECVSSIGTCFGSAFGSVGRGVSSVGSYFGSFFRSKAATEDAQLLEELISEPLSDGAQL